MSRLSLGTIPAALVLAAASAAAPVSAAPAPQAAPVVTASTFTSAPTPWITGSLTPGGTVTANAGTWSPAPSRVTYTFYKFASNGHRITLQTGTSNKYVLQNGDNTYRLKVMVTAERTGYATTSRTSGMSMHVLTQPQWSLFSTGTIPSDAHDWHDRYARGGATTGTTVDVSAVGSRAAYVELTCSTPGNGFAAPYSAGVTDVAHRIEVQRSTTASYIWNSSQPLTHVGVQCGGSWSLIVRPAPTAPIAYSSAKGTDHRGLVYTGPAAYRTFAADGASSLWRQSFQFGPNGVNVYLSYDSARALYRKTPNGPVYLNVVGDGTSAWRMY